MEKNRFPNKLKSYRRSCGYSQKKVARILSLADTSTLSRWEHGVATPSIVNVFRLSQIYRTLPQDLYDELWHQADKEFSLLAQDEEPFSNNQSFYL